MDLPMERIHRFTGIECLPGLLEPMPTTALPTRAVKVIPPENAALMDEIVEYLGDKGRTFTDETTGITRTITVALHGGFSMCWELTLRTQDDAIVHRRSATTSAALAALAVAS